MKKTISIMLIVSMIFLFLPPRPAKAIAPVIAVVGGAEVAGAVFTGLATLVTGLWLTESRPDITVQEAEQVAAYVGARWTDTSANAKLMRQQFSDAMSVLYSPTSPTTFPVPETWDSVVGISKFFDISMYGKYQGYLSKFETRDMSYRDMYYFEIRFDSATSPYRFVYDGTVYNEISLSIRTCCVGSLRIGVTLHDFVDYGGTGARADFDIVEPEATLLMYAYFFDVKNADTVTKKASFLALANQLVPIQHTGTMAPAFPRTWQDVFPDQANSKPRDIVIPTPAMRAYPKDVYGQPDAPELTYRPKTKDYIAPDGAVYPGKDVVTQVPIPRVNEKGQVGVDTPAGDWVGVRPGEANPSIPGEGTGALEKDVSAIRTDVGTITGSISRFFDLSRPVDWQPVQNLSVAFTNKFPFSLPWDIKRAADALIRSPELPTFDLSFYGGKGPTIHEPLRFPKFVEDMAPWIRSSFVMLFTLGLVYATRKLLGGAK